MQFCSDLNRELVCLELVRGWRDALWRLFFVYLIIFHKFVIYNY